MVGDVSLETWMPAATTVARWPNFRSNHSKQAHTNISWPEKIGGRKLADFVQKWQKRGQQSFIDARTTR
jgi:hypothetical protein